MQIKISYIKEIIEIENNKAILWVKNNQKQIDLLFIIQKSERMRFRSGETNGFRKVFV